MNSAAVDVALVTGDNTTAIAGSSSRLADNTYGSETIASKGTPIPQPILIALLAINSALVVAVLAMAGMWLFDRPRG